jgi:hypothetical protein
LGQASARLLQQLQTSQLKQQKVTKNNQKQPNYKSCIILQKKKEMGQTDKTRA